MSRLKLFIDNYFVDTEEAHILKTVSVAANKPILSPYPPMSKSLDYSKIISLLSFSLDIIQRKDSNQNSVIPLNNTNHTLNPLFWDILSRLYLNELRPNVIVSSLNCYDTNTSWLRNLCIYLCA